MAGPGSNKTKVTGILMRILWMKLVGLDGGSGSADHPLSDHAVMLLSH